MLPFHCFSPTSSHHTSLTSLSFSFGSPPPSLLIGFRRSLPSCLKADSRLFRPKSRSRINPKPFRLKTAVTSHLGVDYDYICTYINNCYFLKQFCRISGERISHGVPWSSRSGNIIPGVNKNKLLHKLSFFLRYRIHRSLYFSGPYWRANFASGLTGMSKFKLVKVTTNDVKQGDIVILSGSGKLTLLK